MNEKNFLVTAIFISIALSSLITYSMVAYIPQIQDSLRGSQGVAGINGTDGIDGIDGERGLRGSQGLQGERGEQGEPWRFDGEWVQVAGWDYSGVERSDFYLEIVEFSSDVWRIQWRFGVGEYDRWEWFSVYVYKGQLSYRQTLELIPDYEIDFVGNWYFDSLVGFSSGSYTLVIEGDTFSDTLFNVYCEDFVIETEDTPSDIT